MTPQDWSALAEFLGLVSSGVLLVPAIALNKHLRGVHETEQALESSTSSLFQAVSSAGKPTLTQAKIPKWSTTDENLLILGIVTFGASCLIKLFVALGPGPATSAPQAVAPQSIHPAPPLVSKP